MSTKQIYKRFKKAQQRKDTWIDVWRECYEYALPQREGLFARSKSKISQIYDATAADGVDQLAASILAQLTPPWAKWFGLTPGPEVMAEDQERLAAELDMTSEVLQSHFDRSNFAVEMHQCYLDLVTAGTASLLLESTMIGEASAFKFTAVPLSELVLEEGVTGRLDTTYRRLSLSLEAIVAKYPETLLPENLQHKYVADPDAKVSVIEAVMPRSSGGYDYWVFLEDEKGMDQEHYVLFCGFFEISPFINFRWLKAPGEIYGRSPVMKALPDIKTANKVVELVLKNATIAVTGIWQAEDDGVLNPANIRLIPGAIIPKAVGSKGLTPLESPGKFDISQLMLEDLRTRINHALLADKLGQVNSPGMTATEVLERSAEMARILGATYGRLQSELLTPLIIRALSILRKKGLVNEIYVDGRFVDLQYKSPLARQQSEIEASAILNWVATVQTLGEEAKAYINIPATAKWLGKTLSIPSEIINMHPMPPVYEKVTKEVMEAENVEQRA